MAEKPKSKRKSKVLKGEPEKLGHNLTAIRRDLKPFVEKLDGVHDEMETANGAYMADIKNIYDDAKDKLGVPAKIIRTVYGEHRRLLKQEAREKEMEAADLENLDMLRAALGEFGDMPLGKAAVERAQAVVDGAGA